jgi:hypothetical protein
MEKYKRGGGLGLKGNQSKIDMNKNGKIDAEDFTLLRGSMNGAWRNEHKHVNSTSTKDGKVIQYETRYARKHNPSRKGYKGKGNFEDGGYMDLSKIKANVVNESNPKDTALVPEIDIENVQKLNLDITDNQIKSEADAVRILKQLFDKNSINAYEEVKVLFLDNNNVVIGVYNHSKGGVTGTIVDVEMICALAVKCLAKGVIMCHNHPSGKLVFSDADKTTSLGLKKALNLFTIILLDSIVITNDGYISMSNQGYLERGGAVKYHRGGSLNQHGLEQGDTIIKTIGAFQKIKDKKGNIIYVDLSSGYRDTQPPLPFKVGGDLTFSEKSSAIAKKFEGQAVAPKYQRMYGKRYDKEEAKEVGNKITGKMLAMGMDKKVLGGDINNNVKITPKIKNLIEQIKKDGNYDKGNVQTNSRGIKYRYDEYKLEYPSFYIQKEFTSLTYNIFGQLSLSNSYDFRRINLEDNKVIYLDIPNYKGQKSKFITFRELVILDSDKKALGGFFGKSAMLSTPKVSLEEKQVMLKSGEWVQVLDHSGDSLMVMDLNKLGTGVKPMRINISQVDTSSFMAGGKVVKSKPTTKKSSEPTKRGGAMQLAKEIRKVGEKWTDAVKRASAQLKK